MKGGTKRVKYIRGFVQIENESLKAEHSEKDTERIWGQFGRLLSQIIWTAVPVLKFIITKTNKDKKDCHTRNTECFDKGLAIKFRGHASLLTR